MKNLLNIIPFLALFLSGQVNAEHVFIQDFVMIAERSSVAVRFVLEENEEGFITAEVTAGNGLMGRTRSWLIRSLGSEDFYPALNCLLDRINNPRSSEIYILGSLQECGWVTPSMESEDL